jgi:hypothetical protein
MARWQLVLVIATILAVGMLALSFFFGWDGPAELTFDF